MWAALTGILAVVAIGNTLLTLGLIARIRTLQELVEERLGMNGDLMQPGTPVGDFSVPVTAGEQVDTIDNAALANGTTLVGFFTPGCGKCEEAKAALLAKPPPWPMLAFIEGSPFDPPSQVIADQLCGIARPVFIQHNTDTTRAFGVSGYPTLVRVTDGKVAIAGRTVAEVM